MSLGDTNKDLVKLILVFSSTIYCSSPYAYDPYDCLNDAATVDSNIPIGLATELCSAAWSREPITCYATVPQIDKDIPRGLAVELCSGSINAKNTLDCYAKSGNRNLNRGLAVTLCSANKNKNFIGPPPF